MVSNIRRTLLACLQVYKQWGVVENKDVNGGRSGTYYGSFPLAFSEIYQLVCSTLTQTTSYKATPIVYAYTTSTVTFAAYDGGYVNKTMYIAVGR